MRKRGFTLLELLIVIIILGILAAVAMPRYFVNIEKAREAEARASLGRIREAELAYYSVSSPAGYSGLPISVDVDGDGTADIYLATPQSSSFSYSINEAKTAGIATTTTGGTSHYMCFESGKFGDTTTASCP